MAVVRGAGDPAQPWPERVRVVVGAYLSGTGLGLPGGDSFTSLHDTVVQLVSAVLAYRPEA
jgi:hypothetical protein